MKKSTIVLMAPLLFLALSCEKKIEFRGREIEPRLTVAALAAAGQPFTAVVSSSVFFLQRNAGRPAYTEKLDRLRGRVHIRVNDSDSPLELSLLADTGEPCLRYHCDYVPRPGDRIRLEAIFPNFDPVTAETQVPPLPRFELLSVQREGGDPSGPVEMTIRVEDDGSCKKYYFLLPKMISADGSYVIPFRFSSGDIVFRNVSGGIFDLFDFGSDHQVSYYFSDALIRGKSHTFKIRIPDVPGPEKMEEGGRFVVEMRTVTESLYWYDTSWALLQKNIGGFLGEGVTLYSNVSDGYGVLCASASVSRDAEL